MVTIEEIVQDLKAQWEEAHKAVSKACFAAFKANCNRPAYPNWQSAQVAIAPHNSLSFFKPANIPRFDRNSNVNMFLLLYQSSMYGVDEAMKDATIINFLDTDTQTLLLTCLPENGWTYPKISWALMEEFSSQESLLEQKMDFLDTKLRVGETLEDFTSRFYLEAHTLAFMKALLFLM
ncbi:hypothetical protein DSO57_1000970 [Entomophthora muscae]|uniref:Uncharacterized protein n=1 Tax=Entomophthora muscae TaxID=34485 RepID=A0ACC2UIU0_9FUNG|nr:hypothetical protein DSO57_1000970 [Entomophthora muscae]